MAVLAGGAAFGLGKIASAREAQVPQESSSRGSSGDTSSSGSGGSRGGINREPRKTDNHLEMQDHPTSYHNDTASRHSRSQAAAGPTVVLNVGTAIGGTPRETAQALQKLMNDNASAGKRY